MIYADEASNKKIKASAEANRKAGGWVELPDLPAGIVLDPEDLEEAVPDPSDG